MNNLPPVSIVVIGRNESENLQAVLESCRKINYPKEKIELLYVDNDSTDNSIEIAQQYCDNVLFVTSKWPTPGLARNKGLIAAKNEIIHFLDGDIEIDSNYILNAVKALEKLDTQAVYGPLTEKDEKGVNLVLLAHWTGRKEGYHHATGGGGTYLRSNLLAINGYDERIRKGQETEMGERYLKAGNKIWFINKPMGVHNYGVNSIADLFNIYFLDGLNKSHLILTKGNTKFFKSNLKYSITNIIFCLLSIIMVVLLSIFFKLIGLAAGIVSIYIYFLLKHLLKHRKFGDQFRYKLLTFNMRYIIFAGQIWFFLMAIINRNYREQVIKEKEVFS